MTMYLKQDEMTCISIYCVVCIHMTSNGIVFASLNFNLGKIRTYEDCQLAEALHAIYQKSMSISAASRKYNIPRTTLSHYVKNKCQDAKPIGGPKMLSNSEEKAVVDYIIYMSDCSIPIRRCEVKKLVIVSLILSL